MLPIKVCGEAAYGHFVILATRRGHVVVQTGCCFSAFMFNCDDDFPFPRQLRTFGCHWKWLLWYYSKSATENGWFGVCYWWDFVFSGSLLFSQIFARKELNFERMSERDRKQIVAEVCVLIDSCNFTTD